MHLLPDEIRVLGALIEKEITTPEYYPLSLNALQAAANQRSSRDPVLNLSEDEVHEALRGLEDRGLVNPTRDSRVPKFEHRARTVLNLRRDETAVLCLLLLRGAQTPGELRSRADRLYSFDDLSSVTSTLDRLAGRPAPADPDAPTSPESTGPLTIMLPRQPGARESRYAHLLGGPVPGLRAEPSAGAAGVSSSSETVESMRAELLQLRSTVSALERRVSLLEEGREARSAASNTAVE